MKGRTWRPWTLSVLLVAVMSLATMGCTALLPSTIPYQDKTKMDINRMLSPSESTLMFGHIYRYGKLYRTFFDELYFAQINPDREAHWHYPGAWYTMYYFAPMAPGSVVRCVYWRFLGNTYALPGLSPNNYSLTFTAKKPGLQYIGSHMFADNGFVEDESLGEFEALQHLLPLVKGSSWEPLVAARIEELNK